MLSVVMETHNCEEGLARTLASLIGGSVEGVVRQVLVCDRGSTDGTMTVADHAGCRPVEPGQLRNVLRGSRGEWLLVLEPGARLLDGWIDAVIQHAAATNAPARFTRSRVVRRTLIGSLMGPARPFVDGLLLRRDQAVSLLGSDDLSALRSPRAQRLAAAIVIARP